MGRLSMVVVSLVLSLQPFVIADEQTLNESILELQRANMLAAERFEVVAHYHATISPKNGDERLDVVTVDRFIHVFVDKLEEYCLYGNYKTVTTEKANGEGKSGPSVEAEVNFFQDINNFWSQRVGRGLMNVKSIQSFEDFLIQRDVPAVEAVQFNGGIDNPRPREPFEAYLERVVNQSRICKIVKRPGGMLFQTYEPESAILHRESWLDPGTNHAVRRKIYLVDKGDRELIIDGQLNHKQLNGLIVPVSIRQHRLNDKTYLPNWVDFGFTETFSDTTLKWIQCNPEEFQRPSLEKIKKISQSLLECKKFCEGKSEEE